ncbi:MAG: L-serine ammonia-lyase, iron-sulfur-dependent subunit beta [Christensenellaceae bacterium]|jgi:L-serine dehydratase|nr:L-serine ammonia-lyase, iron-sulfur-dependent subunit beta [Christensenellaceae bacterium]
MQVFKTFDIIGPRMIGPSSSHTAGAARLAHLAWHIAGEDVKKARLTLYGSFAETGAGHGTDKALLAGVLGIEPEDTRLRFALLLAKEAGVEYEFLFEADAPGPYACMARIHIEGHTGQITDVLGASIGGGNIRITNINGLEVEYTGEYPTVLVQHLDMRGAISAVTGVLFAAGINVAGMRVFRQAKGQIACMMIETDTAVSDALCKQVRTCSDAVLDVRTIDKH